MTVFEPMANFQDVWIKCSRDLSRYRLATEDDDVRVNKMTAVRQLEGQISLHEPPVYKYPDLFLASQHSSTMTHLLYLNMSIRASLLALYTLLDRLIDR